MKIMKKEGKIDHQIFFSLFLEAIEPQSMEPNFSD
jgi:hypothetical protein